MIRACKSKASRGSAQPKTPPWPQTYCWTALGRTFKLSPPGKIPTAERAPWTNAFSPPTLAAVNNGSASSASLQVKPRRASGTLREISADSATLSRLFVGREHTGSRQMHTRTNADRQSKRVEAGRNGHIHRPELQPQQKKNHTIQATKNTASLDSCEPGGGQQWTSRRPVVYMREQNSSVALKKHSSWLEDEQLSRKPCVLD